MDAPTAASKTREAVHILPVAPLCDAITSLDIVREVCPPGSAYVNEPLSALTLFLTEQGEAEVGVGGQVIPHRPGGFVLVNRGLMMRERVGPSAGWKVGYMMMSGPWADALGSALNERGRGCAHYPAAPPHWQRQFRELLELGLSQEGRWHWPFLSGCAALFGWVERYPPAPEGTDRLLDDVERLVDTDRQRAWSVDELAGALGMTARQFGYRFSKATGRAPALWLRERRIAAARRLLREGRSVSETADALGFANPYHFSRLFKAVTGVPPSALRVLPGSALHTVPHRLEL